MIGRNIPIALSDHLKLAVTNTARLWKVTKIGMPPIGLTNCDHDIDTAGFSPILGGIVYKAHRGYNAFAIQADADLNVDNSEMMVLLAEDDLNGITLQDISTGAYDDAAYTEYLVNYRDLTQGFVILSSGFIGRVRTVDGIVCFPEVRSLTQTLKQKSMIRRGSVSCPVVAFGDAECKYDVDSEWDIAEIDGIGAETDRIFSVTGSGVIEDDNYYVPGVFEFDEESNNAGKTFEIESYIDGTVTLANPTPKPILSTDGGRIRRDCTRAWSGHNSCQTYNNRPNFRGQPMRPVADTGSLMVPGAN